MVKNRFIAAVLNFAVWGLGYVYLGRNTTFASLLILGSVLTEIALVVPLGEVVLPFGYRLVSDTGFLIVDLAFAYDAYQSAPKRLTPTP